MKMAILSLPDDVITHIFREAVFQQLTEDAHNNERATTPSWWHFVTSCKRIYQICRSYLYQRYLRFADLFSESSYSCPVFTCSEFNAMPKPYTFLPRVVAPTLRSVWIACKCPHHTTNFMHELLSECHNLRSISFSNGSSVEPAVILRTLRLPLTGLHVERTCEKIMTHLPSFPRSLLELTLIGVQRPDQHLLVKFLEAKCHTLQSITVTFCDTSYVRCRHQEGFGDVTLELFHKPVESGSGEGATTNTAVNTVNDAMLHVLNNVPCDRVHVSKNNNAFFAPAKTEPGLFDESYHCHMCDESSNAETWTRESTAMKKRLAHIDTNADTRRYFIMRVHSHEAWAKVIRTIEPKFAMRFRSRIFSTPPSWGFALPFSITLPARVQSPDQIIKRDALRLGVFHNVSLGHVLNASCGISLNMLTKVRVLDVTDECLNFVKVKSHPNQIRRRFTNVTTVMRNTLMVLRLGWVASDQDYLFRHTSSADLKRKVKQMKVIITCAPEITVLEIQLDLLIAMVQYKYLDEELPRLLKLQVLHITDGLGNVVQLASLVDFIPSLPNLLQCLLTCANLRRVAFHTSAEIAVLSSVRNKVSSDVLRKSTAALNHFCKLRPAVDVFSLKEHLKWCC